MQTKIFFILPVEHIIDNLCQLMDSVPPSFPVASSLVVNCKSLIGKHIFHKWKDADSKETWCRGHVLGLVQGISDWYNVQCNGEDDILSLNLLRTWIEETWIS